MEVVLEGEPSGRLVGWATLLGTGIGLALLALLLQVLSDVPNAPASFEQFTPTLWGAFLGAAFCYVAAACIAYRSASIRARRVARLAGVTGVVSLLLWNAPVPFAVQRLAIVGALLIVGGFFALGALRCVWEDITSRPGEGSRAWTGPVMVIGMTSAAAMAMLLVKINEIGWATAID
jgi:hypothetical protein